MKQPLVIYGAGGLGKEILSWIPLLEEFDPVGFLDDGIRRDTVVKGLKVLGGMDVLNFFETPINVVLALGNPISKSTLTKRIVNGKVLYPVLVHPSAILQDRFTISLGEGTIISAGCILTTDIRIGSHVLVNLNTTVGHDVEIGDWSSIMTGINVAGGVQVGEGVLIGSGACIMNQLKVGDFSKIGMGAVVIKNVEANTTVVGVPARRVSS